VANELDELESACPHCGQGVAFTPTDTPQTLICPYCQAEFVVPAIDGATEVAEPDDAADDDRAEVTDDMISAIRVRQLSAERRATYRAGSYCVIAAGVCAVTIAQLAWMIIQHIRTRGGWGIQCTGYLLFIALAAYGLVFFLLRARQFHREAKHSSLVEPVQPPDFSTLDDGSKRVTNLEEVR
jgi:uncharacterized Zn finger protein (UPF0148 family)